MHFALVDLSFIMFVMKWSVSKPVNRFLILGMISSYLPPHLWRPEPSNSLKHCHGTPVNIVMVLLSLPHMRFLALGEAMKTKARFLQ